MSRNEDFSEYVTARWSRLVRSAILLGCSETEAQDIVQSSLERCLIHWAKVERSSDRDAYVHRVLINTFTGSRRRKWTGEIAAPELPDSMIRDQTVDVDQADAVERSLRRLPRDQRAAIVLRYYAHLSEQQTAEALGVPLGTVKSRLSRALTALANDPSLEELRDMR